MGRYRYRKYYEWTPELAYIAGLIAADGCLYNDGRHISLKTKDSELCFLMMDILDLKCIPTMQDSPHGPYVYYNLQVSDVSLYDFFLGAGITPAKSFTIGQIGVPDAFYSDFLRGNFDGDGCISGFKDMRWKNSWMYYASFCSASRAFIAWIGETNTRLAGVSEVTLKRERTVYALKYAKANSNKLFEFMYYREGLPSLTRKRVKYIEFLSLN